MTFSMSKLTASSKPKKSLMSRLFGSSSTKKSSLSRPRKSSSTSSTKKTKASSRPFMSRFRRAPPPSTMDKISAKLNPASPSTPVAVAAAKHKAKKAKSKRSSNPKKSSSTKKSSSFFGRH